MSRHYIQRLFLIMVPIFMLASMTWIRQRHVCKETCMAQGVDNGSSCCQSASEKAADRCCDMGKGQASKGCVDLGLVTDPCCSNETQVLDSTIGDCESVRPEVKKFQFVPDFFLNSVVPVLRVDPPKKADPKPANLLQAQAIHTPPRISYCCFRC
ncbi:MAG: hypothetical protein HYZ16_05475 [Bacteroidetes bacterium]|jgi:hypothetical protein|nr:hypothetical protein [Bacteroidota bacterium]